jgi:hypothetical protein
MIVLIVVGTVIAIGLGLAALYDHRARRRGWRVGVSDEAALENRGNTAATNLEPFVHHDDPRGATEQAGDGPMIGDGGPAERDAVAPQDHGLRLECRVAACVG